jgi:hypothetical protein
MMSLLTELDSFALPFLQRCQSYGLETSVFISVHPWLKIQPAKCPNRPTQNENRKRSPDHFELRIANFELRRARPVRLGSSQRDKPTIARRFNAGCLRTVTMSPAGTADQTAHRFHIGPCFMLDNPAVPPGLGMFCGFNPALKCRAIVITSLRDGKRQLPQSSIPN